MTIIRSLKLYYDCLWYFLAKEGTFEDFPYFKDDVRAKVHVYSIALMKKLWDKPHYRNGTFQQDMVKNLRNVAIPGTGIPLSIFCHYQWTLWLFMFVLYPLVVLIYATVNENGRSGGVQEAFHQQLLNPTDWFSYWRLNCCLASLHSLKTSDEGYDMENKWKFLIRARELEIPVSPWLTTPEVVIKDKNEEGGMGIHFFTNALNGGQWIIQEKLSNAPLVADLLPPTAPLSTFRIMTCSRGGIDMATEVEPGMIQALSCVFRAGFADAKTDHESLMFDVDMRTGRIKKGSTTTHWYKVGLQHFWYTPWQIGHDYQTHPDSGICISGTQLPNINEMIQLVEDAHRKLLPRVPMVGWDVALTTKGILLLELNLSCNFFRGTFDETTYFDMVADYFCSLEKKFCNY